MKKTLKNKIQEKKWTDIPRSWMARLNFVKLSVLPNLTHRFNATSIKISGSYIYVNQQTDFKVYIERQKTQNSQHNIEGEKLEELTLHNYSSQDNVVLQKNRQSMEQNREPRNRPT